MYNNWEGDWADVSSSLGNYGLVEEYIHKTSEALSKLSLGIDLFADAIEKLSNGNDSNSNVNNTNKGSEKVGFWGKQKQNFAADWDYSRCDGVGDYIGTTLNGAVSTVGSVLEFGCSGIEEFFRWIF